MAVIRRSLLKIAGKNIPVLIEGESGTGKEIISKYLHQQSASGRGPFITVNCPAIPGTLLESELFDNDWAAAATKRTMPRSSEIARSGSLFLDEISELSIPLQSKLLRILGDGRSAASNGVASQKTKMPRVICSTNRQLQTEVERGRFRQDLHSRISGAVLRLPPLRHRLEDLEMFVDYFVELYNQRFGCCAPPVSESVLLVMRSHPWTGNIRELENLVKRYVVLGTEEAILGEIGGRKSQTSYTAIARPPAASLGELTRAALGDVEGRIILNALRANQWNRKLTAHCLKISYRSLLYKLKKVGIGNRGDCGAVREEQITLRDLQ